MKTFILLGLVFLLSNFGKAQLTNDYPFKTFLDSVNNLYVTGNDFNIESNSLDITYEKYNQSGEILDFKFYLNSFGNDRGMDIEVDKFGNSYLTGFIYNSITQSNDIIFLKYNNSGNLVMDSVYNSPGDDKGYAIEISKDNLGIVNSIFISGYKTDVIYGQKMFVKKIGLFSETSWTREIPGSQCRSGPLT